ncbi:transcriptional regulator, IclR family [Variovorax sp. YR266]|uniref:IclR family transcriptional regulator n=1 Tax=Variovorax sp. YR266 TaxID=1884386 RepID=UPI00089507F1|nr:helix-turn-helix domain-containing protein [Variovorax sp. YR266]SDY34941.1 transcriptional regulator, IclR family [Variovorax sp. YR266]
MAKGIQSIEVGYRILTAVQEGPGAVSLKEIAARAGLAGSAAHNYLVSFLRIGMVTSSGRGQYRLGPALASLGMTAARDVEHFDLIRERAIALSEATGLGTAVVSWSSAGPLILFNKGDVRNQIFALRNGLVPARTTAAGHVFVTYLPRELTLSVIVQEMAAEAGSADEAQAKIWIEDVAQGVRDRGYAVLELSGLPGYGAIGAPLWNAEGQLANVLSITGPLNLMDRTATGAHIPLLLNAARDLSRLMGAPPSFWRN